MGYLLETIDLIKRFPVKSGGKTKLLHAVESVNFHIASGETVGLVGESGCGKSTLVRLLTRTLDLTDGQVRFVGADLGLTHARDMARHPKRHEIQMVFQDPNDSLNPRYKARDAIAEPLKLLIGMRVKRQIDAEVSHAASLVGLPPELLDRYPHQLSGGQKARVGIARAIVTHPRLLILDEPTAALDVSVQAVILQLLDRLKRELGMSMLFVSHDLNVVRLLCNRVIVMYLGQIVESGPTEAVFSQPLHPYTRALIASLPGQISRGDALPEYLLLPREVQSPIDPDPNRCRVYGRCPHGQPYCSANAPVLQPHANKDRLASCHFPLTQF
jgi:oligopeptide/dipeptide ABC transporter ATP-binding protein